MLQRRANKRGPLVVISLRAISFLFIAILQSPRLCPIATLYSLFAWLIVKCTRRVLRASIFLHCRDARHINWVRQNYD